MEEAKTANENNSSEVKTYVKVMAKYKRCSTDKQDLQQQDDALEKFIERHRQDNPNLEVKVEDYSDSGFSGKNSKRKELQKLIEKVKTGKIDVVIFTKLDRLARSLQDLLDITNEFRQYGTDFVVTEQQLNTTTPQGKLLFHIMGAFAEFERNLINERLRSGKERAKISGTKSGKPMHRPKKELDEDGIIHKFKYKGMSQNQIAKHYNISITPVRRVLKNNGYLNSKDS